ncbi:hypothetical protein I4U23_022966 [Adineta vaga]|nr:hypothetical protein I4U23_022966 [Adineta vaga]
MINNRTCHDFQKLNYIPYYNLPGINNQTEKNFFHGCISYGKMDNVKLCQNPALYRCMSSEKCISKHRLVDGIQDCFHGDDETYSSSCMLNHQHRFRCTSELNRCIAPINVGNFIWDCLGGEDEINKRGTDHHKSITFPMFCDGFFDMRFDRNAIETDETNCESWPCINQYTRCNGHSNCRNGADELNCGQTVCSLDTHPCVSPITNQLICIGLNKTGDGHIDCLGASDERYICRQSMSFKPTEQFNCWNHSMCLSSEALCDEQPNCLYGDDEQFCEKIYNPFDINTRCDSVWNGYRSASEEFLCSLTDEGKPETVYFALQNVTVQPLPNMISPIHTPFLVTKHQMSKRQNINFMDLVSYCNRGIVVYENETENKKCLCPPSYYGERCEYQTDRVSITMQIQSTELRTIYSIVLILVDDVGHIHSVEQHSYLSMRDCANKINTYLLYQHHHKELNGKSYFVHIHIFDKLTLKYRFSWSFPLLFLFLPVQRLAIQVIVPNREFKKIRNCPLKCFHGRCQQFLNNLTYFCQCDRHWSGPLCSIQSNCDCSDNSLCIGSIHNRSICICPLYKFGSYCYLTQSVCQPETCKNQGTCVPTDERISNTEFTCICKEGYTGLRCENIDMRLVISFSYDMIIPPSIFVHFITTFTNAYPQRTTTIKKIGFDQNSNDNNNLKNYNQSVIILDSVSTSQRCPSIKDLLNTTIFSFSRFRFVKYYHLPCQERSTLNCFYDDIYLCIDYCDNKAICLQNNPTCPDTVVCSCSECFHGSRCQFTTKGFELSLDTILGYHLHPNVAFIRQPPVVKVSIGLTMFILLAGLIILL